MWLQKWIEVKDMLQRTICSNADACCFWVGSLAGEVGWKSCLQPPEFTGVESLGCLCLCPSVWMVLCLPTGLLPLERWDLVFHKHQNRDELSIWYSAVSLCCNLLAEWLQKKFGKAQGQWAVLSPIVFWEKIMVWESNFSRLATRLSSRYRDPWESWQNSECLAAQLVAAF